MSELLVQFELQGELVAIRASEVESVIEIDEVVPVPLTSSRIAGLTALRSKVLTLLSCDNDTAPCPASTSAKRRAIVVTRDGQSYGILTNRVVGGVPMLSPAVPFGEGVHDPSLRAIAQGVTETPDGPVLLIDTEAAIMSSIRSQTMPCQ
jgi:purine-binding chemotaxis protein CheW